MSSSTTTTTTTTPTTKVQFAREENQVHYIDTTMEPSQKNACFYQPEDYLQFRAKFYAFKREEVRQAKLLQQFNNMTTRARLQQGKIPMPVPVSSSRKPFLTSQMKNSIWA